MDLAGIGAAIRSARRAKGLTQEALGARAGVSRATINGLETGAVRELGFHKVEAILAALGLHLAPVRASGKSRAAFRPRPSSSAAGALCRTSGRPLLRRLARRYMWWQPPHVSVRDPRRVIAQVMDTGTLEDIQRLAAAVGEPAMVEVLARARPGWFRPKSWAFWHAALGLSKKGAIPPVPARRTDALPDAP